MSQLPDSLMELSVASDQYDQPLMILPHELCFLSLKGRAYNQPLHLRTVSLSSLFSLKKIVLGDSFNSPVNFLLPYNLEELKLGHSFDKSIDHIPETIRILRLGCMFSQRIHFLPPALEHLEFSFLCLCSKHPTFNHPFPSFPRQLSHLLLNNDFNQSLNDLPESLEVLQIGDGFRQRFSRIPANLSILLITECARQRNLFQDASFQEQMKYVRVRSICDCNGVKSYDKKHTTTSKKRKLF